MKNLKNEIMDILMESKLETLSKEVLYTKMMEDVNYDILKSKPELITKQEITNRLTKLFKLVCKLRDLQHDALAYANENVMMGSWKLEKGLYETMDEYRNLLY